MNSERLIKIQGKNYEVFRIPDRNSEENGENLVEKRDYKYKCIKIKFIKATRLM